MMGKATLLTLIAGGALPVAALLSTAGVERMSQKSDTLKTAFPGAEGYGAMAVGGRGGRVIAVTTLADSGSGSLRACIDHQGPRVCVFRVAGVIRFTQRPPIITNPFITIAGQTAPGGGITLAHGGGPWGVTPLLIKDTNDVVIRDIRVRPDMRGDVRGGNDAITFENSRNIILDHVSGSWALDENINGQGDNDNVTISWSIFAEGIPKHDKCALLGSDPTKPQRMSFIYNVCAHNGDRNPDMNFTPKSCIDIINNIFYDAGSQFAELWESYGGTWANIVGNIFRAGPSTSPQAIGIDRQQIGSRGAGRLFLQDNLFEGTFIQLAPSLSEIVVDSPVCPLSIKPMTPQAAYGAILQQAGAFPRDAIDRRIVAEIRDRTGHIRKQPGAIPSIALGETEADSDGDGMPDTWERAHGTQAGVSDPWQDADRDGVLNLDEYLDDAHRRLVASTD
ncbi:MULTISPECIES: polysaccharide lyase family 1 protein [Sphingobium]|nr:MULTISPECIES: pectate lyase [Sphingobium]